MPLQLSQPSYAMQFLPSDLPDTVTAADEYEQEGGSLTRISSFGTDPLNGRQDLITIRDRCFASDIGSFEAIFTDVVSNSGNLLEHALLHFLSLTLRLSNVIIINNIINCNNYYNDFTR